MKQVADVAVK
ncbi:hypothetical protein ECPA4_2354, partial [Escherichia coli PA4]